MSNIKKLDADKYQGFIDYLKQKGLKEFKEEDFKDYLDSEISFDYSLDNFLDWLGEHRWDLSPEDSSKM